MSDWPDTFKIWCWWWTKPHTVNKVNFIENVFRSRLTLVSSNDIITIKIKKLTNVKNNKKKGSVRGEKETNDQIVWYAKRLFAKILFLKNGLRQLLFLEIIYMYEYKVYNSHVFEKKPDSRKCLIYIFLSIAVSYNSFGFKFWIFKP